MPFFVFQEEDPRTEALPSSSDIYFFNSKKERFLLVVKVVKLYYVDIFQGVKTYRKLSNIQAVQNTT
jgi:hypothetical protein